MAASTTEIAAALQGAIRLAQLDAGGLKFFDRTLGGFWRSFVAAAMVAPVRIAVLILTGEVPAGTGVPRAVAVEIISYAIGWLIYPFAMLFAVDLLKRRERYFDYLVPYNWANVPAAGLFLMVAGLGTLLPAPLYNLLSLVALISVLIYQWFIARIGLMVSASVAVALVLLDLVLYLVMTRITQLLLAA
ncbi:MAG: hypothetical protein HY060_22210 [Proteobacteria bacterium]|nr:hypothetical protein [Pseudomonadota bacterium]